MKTEEIEKQIERMNLLIQKGRNVSHAAKRLAGLKRLLSLSKIEKVCPVCGKHYTAADEFEFHDEHWNPVRTTIVCPHCADVFITPPWEYEAFEGVEINGDWLGAICQAELVDWDSRKKAQRNIIQTKRDVYMFLLTQKSVESEKMLKKAQQWLGRGWKRVIVGK